MPHAVHFISWVVAIERACACRRGHVLEVESVCACSAPLLVHFVYFSLHFIPYAVRMSLTKLFEDKKSSSLNLCVAAHCPFVWSVIYFVCFKTHSTKINTWSAFGFQMWFTFESDAVHLCRTWKRKKILAKQQKSNAVHYDICRGSLAPVSAVHSC